MIFDRHFNQALAPLPVPLTVFVQRIKYLPEQVVILAKSQIAQTVRSKRTEEGQLLISVSDSEIGLPGGEADRIFEAFFTTKEQGTGMGLSISRRIIESHGGSLWASANSGRGATFQFTLPTNLAASSPSAA